MAHTVLIEKNLPRGPLQVSELVSKSPTVAKIDRQEFACSSDLEAILRARKYHDVAACTTAALDVEAPKELDVDVQPTAVTVPSTAELAHPEIEAELARQVLLDPRLIDEIKANYHDAETAPSAAVSKRWDLASAGHVLTGEELLQMVRDGQASLCLVITKPAGAEIYIDGNGAGRSPWITTLVRHVDVARTITITMEGYATVEKNFVPDGKDIVLSVSLKKKPL